MRMTWIGQFISPMDSFALEMRENISPFFDAQLSPRGVWFSGSEEALVIDRGLGHIHKSGPEATGRFPARR